jgi:hypothetical protein
MKAKSVERFFGGIMSRAIAKSSGAGLSGHLSATRLLG